MAPNCVFCQAQGTETSSRPENTKLMSSDRFVLMPALGPLVPGHVLLVSREHALSFASMGQSVVVEYERVVDAVAARYAIPRRELLEAEHGASDKHSGGGCIGHTHINLIPGLGNLVELFDGTLDAMPHIRQLDDVMSIRGPYVLMRAGEKIRVYAGGSVPSQLIRRRIYEHLGRDDWDWAIFPHLESVASTVDLWNRP
jgi:diadenosine tetraphosphate (Ap4A) HIT family hydrolase